MFSLLFIKNNIKLILIIISVIAFVFYVDHIYGKYILDPQNHIKVLQKDLNKTRLQLEFQDLNYSVCTQNSINNYASKETNKTIKRLEDEEKVIINKLSNDTSDELHWVF